MGRTVISPDVGKEIVAALGLPGHRVRAVSLHFAVDSFPVADVTMLVPDDKRGALVEIVKRYELIEIAP